MDNIEVRSILYFDPFYFKNGNTAKAKFFLVLKRFESNSLLVSLPTSQDFIPENLGIDAGCIEQPEININCFVISQNSEITECGKHFSKKTFIYGHQIDEYDLAVLKSIYPIEHTDYNFWGIMRNDIFEDLLVCLKNSQSVKRRFKRLLNEAN